MRIAESTTRGYFLDFITDIVEIYEKEYLRAPTDDDVRKYLALNETRGFPGNSRAIFSA